MIEVVAFLLLLITAPVREPETVVTGVGIIDGDMWVLPFKCRSVSQLRPDVVVNRVAG